MERQSNGVALPLSLPLKTRVMVSLLSLATDFSRRSNGTINRRLLRLFDFRSPPTPNPTRGGVSSSDHTIDPSRNLWFRVFVPAADKHSPPALPVVLFFHGGGFAFLSPDAFAYDAVCRKLARLIPAVVVSVNYRLAPEHRHPCQYDDGFDALNFIAAQLNNLLPPAGPTADVTKCFLGGDSAGANLAHHVAVRACRENLAASGGRGAAARVVGVIAIQPFFGGEERTAAEIRLARAPIVNLERTDWMWRAFLPEGADRDHPSVNVSGPHAEDIAGLLGYPKTLVVVGGFDPLQDWQRRYFEWLRSSGKDAVLLEYPDMIHAFYIFPELPKSHHLLLQIKDFVASLS